MSAVTINELCQIDGYLGIPISAARRLTGGTVDLFTCGPEHPKPVLLAGGMDGLSKIDQFTHSKVLVRRCDLAKVASSISSDLDALVTDNRITVGERFALFQVAVLEQLEQNFRRHSAERYIDLAQKFGRQIATLLAESPVLAAHLHAHLLRDDSTAAHVTNVAAYSVLLAYETGIHGSDELVRIATGALLHEFGKLHISIDLLQKTGRLTLKEREQLERAPQLGYEALCTRDDLDFGQLMMVYQQHERHDGSGYPVGVENDEIHPWARILAVTDVFDSMISNTPYRRENRVSEALAYLADNASRHFHPEVVTCWMTIFPQQ